MDNGARDKRLLILAEPCVKTEDAVAIVDQVFLSALTKLRDIAELSAPDNQQRKRSAAPELMCALGTLQIACSHLRVTDPQHTAYPVAGRNLTVSINLLRNIVEQNPDMKIEVWSMLSASDIVSVINHSHKSILTLLSALNLVHLLSSGTSHEGQDWEMANEVRANLVQSGILRAFLDLISIHDGNKDTDFEFPLSVIRITTDCLLLFGHRHFVHDPEHVLTYPRLNRTLWIIYRTSETNLHRRVQKRLRQSMRQQLPILGIRDGRANPVWARRWQRRRRRTSSPSHPDPHLISQSV